MNPSPAPFFSLIQSMTRSWENLIRENLAFLEDPTSNSRLQGILDQRELVLEENRSLDQRFLSEWAEAFPGQPVRHLREALTILRRNHPAGESAITTFHQALEQLVDTDRKVQERLQQSRKEIDAQLKALKRSSSLVKGYKQATPFDDSCFIDKIR